MRPVLEVGWAASAPVLASGVKAAGEGLLTALGFVAHLLSTAVTQGLPSTIHRQPLLCSFP